MVNKVTGVNYRVIKGYRVIAFLLGYSEIFRQPYSPLNGSS